MNKEVLNINDKGEYHGYQEWYNLYNKLWHRSNCKNGMVIGYTEHHMLNKCAFFIR